MISNLTQTLMTFSLILFLSINAHCQNGTEKVQVYSVEPDESFEATEEMSSEKIYEFVDVNAEFPGGQTAMMQHIRDSIVYPQEALENGIQGKVYVSFVVRVDGSIDNIHIDRSPDNQLSTEAIRVLKTFPKMIPAKLNGEDVPSRYRLPISFVLTK